MVHQALYVSAWGEEWTGAAASAPAIRSGNSRRPRAPNKPGQRRRGNAQGIAAKVAATLATGTDADSFVQLCENDDVIFAYKIIVVLLCFMLLGCFCICEIYSSKKAPTTVRTESASACAGLDESIVAPADKAEHPPEISAIW